MRHLIRLVTPPGGTVLDPFTGSGSTGIAAVLEGFKFIGIEQSNTPDEPYVDIARARISHVAGGAFTPEAGRATGADGKQQPEPAPIKAGQQSWLQKMGLR